MKNHGKEKYEIWMLLHDIRSSHNVGSLLRTGDAIGVSRVYLSGYTPLPVDRFKRPNKEIAKTALGAEDTIPWNHCDGFEEVLTLAKQDGFVIIGLEQDERAVDYKKIDTPEKALLVVGSEVEGMAPELRALCDTLIEIPMYGKKESLNVAVAAGIALFRLFDND